MMYTEDACGELWSCNKTNMCECKKIMLMHY